MKNRVIKLFLLFLSMFVISGCVSVKKEPLDNIVSYVIGNNRKIYNNSNRGYKYYIPRGLSAQSVDNLNVIIKNDKYKYYLYVDLVSFYNKTEMNYKEDKSLYYSKSIRNNEGIINVTKLAEGYLVNVQYNYAKIEVIVAEKDIKETVCNALIIVSSVDYNENAIKAMLDEGILSTKERVVEVFKNPGNRNDLLETDDVYEDDENVDVDYIN